MLFRSVPVDEADKPVGRDHLTYFDARANVEILPLTGIALPYEAGDVAMCRIGPRIARLPAVYRDAVMAEAERVSRRVIVDVADGGDVADGNDRS